MEFYVKFSTVTALAVGQDGKVYSGSIDRTIRVWSGVDGALFQTLPHGRHVSSLAFGVNGVLYIGGLSGEICACSCEDGTVLHTLQLGSAENSAVSSMAVGIDAHSLRAMPTTAC
jgi:WD40 repeat protein